MVNPYALSSRTSSKSQVSLSQSQGLKKWEKFERRAKSPAEKKASRVSLDSSNDEQQLSDNDDSPDDDSVFMKNLRRSSNRFLKGKKKDSARNTPEPAKSPRQDNEQDEEDEDIESEEIEISAASENRTPTPSTGRNQGSPRKTSQLNRVASAASSVSSIRSLGAGTARRTPSRVKFISDEINEETSLIEELISKNLVLSIEDLEAPAAAASALKFIKDRKASNINGRRSESAASVKEVEEEQFSSITESASSTEFEQPNFVLDIADLDKSSNEDNVKPARSKSAKKPTKRPEPKTTKQPPRAKSPAVEDVPTEESSIATELEVASERPRAAKPSKKNKTSTSEIKTQKSKSRTYKDDFNTSADESTSMTSRTLTQESVSKSKRRHKDSKKEKRHKAKPASAEAQVDTHDLLKYSDVLRSVNAYNPTSLMLSSLSFLQDSSSLRELNQVTGYNLINETFNDLIRMNLTFFKNFLTTQRSLYEQQLQCIQPK